MADRSKQKTSNKKTPADLETDNGKSSSGDSKKPPMKTATDVISRILWDSSLPQNKFVVGYLDRFDGITEKSFESLDWRDPSIVDNYSLALPKHRIQYFKYKNRKVWDKRNRKDIVFGSTGHAISIYDFIASIDREEMEFCDEDVKARNFEAITNVECLDETESDDDYDTLDRPNFFIAARVTNEDTVKNLKEVSDYIKSRDELIGECCIAPEIYHLTLSILKLNSASDVNNAVSALQSLASQKLPVVTVNLEGLDNFRHRVLYSRITEIEELCRLRKVLVEELVSRKVTITDKFSFVPHVTVAKLSRSATRMRHSKYIDQYLYLKFEDNEFGKEKISNLFLCEMGAERREDGFYKCACEISLN